MFRKDEEHRQQSLCNGHQVVGVLGRLILLIAFVAGCGRRDAGPASSTSVAPTVITAGTPWPSPTPPVCATLTGGASLDLDVVSIDTVRLAGKGFEPGEQVILVLSSESDQRSQRIEYRPVEPIGPNGRFTITHRIGPLRDTSGRVLTNTWQVVLIHDDSAVCRTITLPLGE